ncbi:MAG: signal transduction histidine kinase (STHK), LytS [Pseudanabaena sp.]|nr:MAG: signal transduction histidine kinase (STHK), LytS [Pseudanabaena sp.]
MNDQLKCATGTFASHQEAESALAELRDSGFNMGRISIIGNNVNRGSDMVGAQQGEHLNDLDNRDRDNKVGEGAATGAASGGAVGGLTGLLVGLGLVAISGVGPVMMAGALATTLATTLSGGAIGAATGGLLGGLVGLGIPKDRAKIYSDRVEQGDYLVMVDGTDQEVRRAEEIFQRHGIREWGIYNSDNASTRTGDVSLR